MIAKGRYAAAVVALAASATFAQPAAAQREIVQPLPAEGERRLSDALSRLARDTTDVDAVLDAGEAALELNDIDAAIGFFGRANELSPGNSRTKLGLARAYLRSRRPVEALRLFAEAERAGVSEARMAEDRGLAFDLVGDAASAQELYRLALANGAGEETVRRLALSQAIAGDREEFEATLLPLLEKGDVAAFRTRAFGLAILGNPAEAKQIANTMLPAGLGARMAAYFDYMPRLTQAQQAAAGNLGIFPRTASIGTDDARIAGYERTARRSAPAPTPSAVRIAPAAPEVDPRASQARRRPDLTGSPASVPAPSTAPETLMASERAESSAEAPTPTPVSSNPTPVPTIATTLDVAAQPPSLREPIVIARVDPSQVSTAAEAKPDASGEPAPPTRTTASLSPAPAAQEDPPRSVADAFDGFTLAPAPPPASASGAVDITRIAIPREKAEPKPPPPPAHPARHWVQVATGKDRDALKFDWRRIARKAEGLLDGKGPFVTPWVEANRLLSGPYDSATKAREMMNQLKALGVDSFTFTSAEGEAIEKL